MPPAKQQLWSCAEALALVEAAFADLPLPPVRTVPLGDALGSVLAQAVHADRDQPPFPRSTRDGFALRSADLCARSRADRPGDGTSLHIIGSIRAGEQWTGAALQPGEALEIMTGAPVPGGADAVLMLEHGSRDGDELRPHRSLGAGENIVPQAAEARSGQLLLRSHIRIGPAEIALAASVGCSELHVFERPLVAILSTGDELVSVQDTAGPQQIRNSNAHALAALIRQNGGTPHILPVAADTRESLEEAVELARDAAMLILSGGVSAGRYDLVEPVLLSQGAEFLFTGVLMQPGKPAVFGRMPRRDRTQWIFGLPGNPVSTQVTAMLFAMPMLRALAGEIRPEPVFASATLAEAVAVRPGLTRFLPANVTSNLTGTAVTPTRWQGSGDLNANARANCYLVLSPDVEQLSAGSIVQVLLR